MKKNYFKYITPFLILSLFLFTACEEETPQQPTGKAYMGGTEGLIVQFEPISIKDGSVYSVFDDEEFPLEIIVRNKGEEDIESGDLKLTLLGPAKNDFSGITWEKNNQDKLEKISEFNARGGEETITFADNANYQKEVIGAIDFTWNVNYEYKYKTHLLIDDVCFKEDLQDDRVCEVNEDKTFSVSSAPITVTSVKEESAGGGIIRLVLEVQNIGTGDSAVVGEEFNNRFDRIGFTMEDSDKWDCTPKDNTLRLDKATGIGTLYCKIDEPLAEGEIYSSPVKMTLEYLYQDLIKETLRMKETTE